MGKKGGSNPFRLSFSFSFLKITTMRENERKELEQSISIYYFLFLSLFLSFSLALSLPLFSLSLSLSLPLPLSLSLSLKIFACRTARGGCKNDCKSPRNSLESTEKCVGPGMYENHTSAFCRYEISHWIKPDSLPQSNRMV